MSKVFLSYARADHYFADLAAIKLQSADIELWRDQGQLRPGTEWRLGIERGISECSAVLVALSEHSSQSAYVTFEWAYALGSGKSIIPAKLSDCKVHPRLDIIQHLDFTIPGALPWEPLIERIREVELDQNADQASPPELVVKDDPDKNEVKAILSYLNKRGYQMVSFDRIRRRIDPGLTDERLREIVASHGGLFRLATLEGRKPGLAKLIP